MAVIVPNLSSSYRENSGFPRTATEAYGFPAWLYIGNCAGKIGGVDCETGNPVRGTSGVSVCVGAVLAASTRILLRHMLFPASAGIRDLPPPPMFPGYVGGRAGACANCISPSPLDQRPGCRSYKPYVDFPTPAGRLLDLCISAKFNPTVVLLWRYAIFRLRGNPRPPGC